MATHHTDKTGGKSERLSVLTDAEKFALYGLPDFDEGQQREFLSLSAGELELATSRPGLLHFADRLFQSQARLLSLFSAAG